MHRNSAPNFQIYFAGKGIGHLPETRNHCIILSEDFQYYLELAGMDSNVIALRDATTTFIDCYGQFNSIQRCDDKLIHFRGNNSENVKLLQTVYLNETIFVKASLNTFRETVSNADCRDFSIRSENGPMRFAVRLIIQGSKYTLKIFTSTKKPNKYSKKELNLSNPRTFDLNNNGIDSGAQQISDYMLEIFGEDPRRAICLSSARDWLNYKMNLELSSQNSTSQITIGEREGHTLETHVGAIEGHILRAHEGSTKGDDVGDNIVSSLEMSTLKTTCPIKSSH